MLPRFLNVSSLVHMHICAQKQSILTDPLNWYQNKNINYLYYCFHVKACPRNRCILMQPAKMELCYRNPQKSFFPKISEGGMKGGMRVPLIFKIHSRIDLPCPNAQCMKSGMYWIKFQKSSHIRFYKSSGSNFHKAI